MPSLRIRVGIVVVAAVALLPSCEGSSEPTEDFPAACNLPSPEPDLDISEVPGTFVVRGAVVRNVETAEGLLIIALNVPQGIEETFNSYKDAFDEAAYDRIGEDFEGFEAELYLREKSSGDLVSVQVRRPNCNEASSVTINVNQAAKTKS